MAGIAYFIFRRMRTGGMPGAGMGPKGPGRPGRGGGLMGGKLLSDLKQIKKRLVS